MAAEEPVDDGNPFWQVCVKRGNNMTNNRRIAMTAQATYTRHIYWLDEAAFKSARALLRQQGYRVNGVLKTPCEVLNARENKVLYAAPPLWSRICVRQGSWYRQSDKAGKTLMVSEARLPGHMDAYLDATLTESDFMPAKLPTARQKLELVESDSYRTQRPDEWERPGMKDSFMFKTLFSLTGFWGLGDNMRKHWLNHRANHANFLDKRFTTEIDGERVPYSVTENSGVCSSCVEFFNVTSKDTRKLVRACPGSITFASVERDHYYDVKPIDIPIVVNAAG
jgi:hypothetical protein